MNCKPGDLAIVVKPGTTLRNLGKIVTCLNVNGELWFVRGMSRCYKDDGSFEHHGYIEDCRLRPIRPGDITDEEVRDLYAPKVPELA